MSDHYWLTETQLERQIAPPTALLILSDFVFQKIIKYSAPISPLQFVAQCPVWEHDSGQ